MTKKQDNYIDGYAYVYRQKKIENEFGAKIRPKTIEDMLYINKAAYDECSRRVSDLEFAQAYGKSLSLKICCPLGPDIDINDMLVINGKIYSIIDKDIDKKNRRTYLYLEEVSNVKSDKRKA